MKRDGVTCRECGHRFDFPYRDQFPDFDAWNLAMARWAKDIADHYRGKHGVEVPILGDAANRILSRLN